MDPVFGIQMLFVAFGALVLVPILTGLNPGVALFTAGVGTLLFQLGTGRQVPVFLASSLAFIAPIIYGVQTWGLPATLSGLCAAGVVYVLLGILVSIKGREVVCRYLPAVVVGPVIMIIGLSLAPVTVNLALGKSGDGSAVLVDMNKALTVSGVSLVTVILTSLFTRGITRSIPSIDRVRHRLRVSPAARHGGSFTDRFGIACACAGARFSGIQMGGYPVHRSGSDCPGY